MPVSPRSSAEAAVRIGQVFLGKYRVDGILGQGGMGVVAECTHLQLNERVAVKMLRPDVLIDDEAVQRFMREAQAAVKLKSEYVAKVTDVGALESGTPYMVMEFLEGIDLGAMITERGHLPVPWATELILQTAEALAEAHSIGIVHRDIKPANLFVTWRPDGTSLIKVLDFGISKSPMGTDMQLTQTQSLLGTPAYMSPEQMRSAHRVDARTDMWSLGTVLYELLEGRKPFEAESFSEMCVKVAVDPPIPMQNAPPQLEAIIMRCLAKTPEQRFPSMAELGRELIPFARDPQQGAVLVERMQRMLRRGDAAVQNANWEGQTTSSGRDSVSGLNRTPSVWDIASNPAMRAFHPAHDRTPLPGVPQHQPRERSVPAMAITEALTEARIATQPIAVPNNRKKLGVIFGVIGMFALFGIVFALIMGGSAPPATPAEKTPAPIVMPAATPDTPTAPTPVDRPSTQLDVQPRVEPPPLPQEDPPKPATVKKTQPKVIKKTQGKQPEQAPPPTVETKTQPKVNTKCDPYANAHGCNGKKK